MAFAITHRSHLHLISEGSLAYEKIGPPLGGLSHETVNPCLKDDIRFYCLERKKAIK